MAFVDDTFQAVYAEIRRRQEDAGRLSLVEFDEAEYRLLLSWARRIVREYGEWRRTERQQARLVFLAFAIAFVSRTKYTDDSAFWPDFEQTLGLSWMERRFPMMDDLLWPAYKQEGFDLSYDGRGRRIVGTLEDEMRQARTWVTQARTQFVEFFLWYYRRYPDSPLTPELMESYRRQTGAHLVVLDKVLPALQTDCQALATVLDYSLEHDLYLHANRLTDYRAAIIQALGPEYDPIRLRLIRDERALVKLILDLQNHRTPAQFERELLNSPGSRVTAPWGESLPAHQAHRRWPPLAYGRYRLGEQEYRVVPHPRLRLEMLDAWPFEQVVSWGAHSLGYKKATAFQVEIGRRTVQARPYIPDRRQQVYIWTGEAPVGQKLTIDGHLRPEPAGADWQVGLRLDDGRGDRPGLCIAIERLTLYYPDQPHAPVRVWSTEGYEFTDRLRQDGVRRFHRHGALVIPLPLFEQAVGVGVAVDGQQVLDARFQPDPHMLFSVSSREMVRGRGRADVGDREYILFTQPGAGVLPGPGLRLEILPSGLGNRDVYRVIWEDPSWPFDLRVRMAHWAFERRREFTVLISVTPSVPHVRLRTGQAHRFADISLVLFSTLDPTREQIGLEVLDEDGELTRLDLIPYVTTTDTPSFYAVDSALWQRLDRLRAGQCGSFALIFRHQDQLLDELRLSVVPTVTLVAWDAEAMHSEGEAVPVTIETEGEPVWDPVRERSAPRVTLALRPRLQPESWPEHPGLRRLVPQPISAPVVFPVLGETVEVVVHPRLFGWRLYKKRSLQTNSGQWQTDYQSLEEADHYHLRHTVLHVFAAPETSVKLAVDSLVVWHGQTDTSGDLLLEDLSFLRDACTSEWTDVTVRCGSLAGRFTVRWAPVVRDLKVVDNHVVVTFEGPEDTAVRLNTRDLTGRILTIVELPCQGRQSVVEWTLPAMRSQHAYVQVEYVSSTAQGLLSIWQAHLVSEGNPVFPEWLEAGVGVMDWQDVSLLLGVS